MRVFGLPKEFRRVARAHPPELDASGEERLRWVKAWRQVRARGISGEEAAAMLDKARATLYRWERRLQQDGPRGLMDRSRAPRRRRQPTWSPELAQAVQQLRETYPRWGKEKLAVLLRREGWSISTSMVGRILKRLKDRGVLREPGRNGLRAWKRPRPRPYAVRKPKEYQPQQAGDLVQVDTLDVRPLPGVILKHLTARDVISRWDVLEVHTRATAATAKGFLAALQVRMPFPIRALQVDGGSEFQGVFEEACREAGIPLYVLPPRSPKLNGHVERAQRTHTEEFYELYDGDLDVTTLNRALLQWEQVYNQVRPHRALGNLTPLEYLGRAHSSMPKSPSLSHM